MNVEFKLPELGENVDSGDVVKVLVGKGDRIAANDSVVELETDKAVVELPCPHAGTIVEIHVKQGDSVKVGQSLLSVEADAEGEQVVEQAGEQVVEREAEAAEQPPEREPAVVKAAIAKPQAAGLIAAGLIAAGPAARRVARELGVDLRHVRGSGQRGRITPEDVRAAAGTQAPEPTVSPGESAQEAWGPIRRERMSKIRRTIAAQMAKSATTIPHVTNFDDADVTLLEELRQGVPPGHLGEGIKLTAMPLVLKAVALALRQHPTLNATLDDENQEIVYKEYVNLGVAVDTPRGLVVPVLRNVDRLSIAQIAADLKTLAARARAAEFAIEDLRGGTFTISNLGAVGGTYSTPIINHPEVAILLLGRSRWTPVVHEGDVEKRLMMPLSLSFDHRLVDGAMAGRFLNDVIDYLESPGKLLLTPGGM